MDARKTARSLSIGGGVRDGVVSEAAFLEVLVVLRLTQRCRLAFVFFFLSGLASVAHAQSRTSLPVGVAVDRKTSLLRERDMFVGGQSVAGRFNSNTIFLAEQLHRNASNETRSWETVVSTVMDLNNLESASPLGRLIGEHLAHHLIVRGWSIVEPRLNRELAFNDAGEFAMSHTDRRKPFTTDMRNIVTGTYLVTSDGILVNLKMDDSSTGRIVSSAQTRIPRDAFALNLVESASRSIPVLAVTR